ncbi:maltase 2-like [Sipha flava]|uniref:alpha-glucosidase n=1 Tax=Sipha flava TaxID=143950 RepID=A0A8B8FMP6_9HEMI|nr:maltase 2-like [Sipha flava]
MNTLASCNEKFCMILMLLNSVSYSTKAKTIFIANEKSELDWWQTAVFYEIYPRSFKDSDKNAVGDIKGIEEKAEYLKEIGVDCVWLSPIFKSPMADFGFDISDFYQVDSIYGTNEDLISLQKKLKSLGIRIILDFVPNHTSDEHEWFKKSVQKIDPYTDYYVWRDAKIDQNGWNLPPNNWQSLFSKSAWTWNEKRKQYYLHQFSPKEPDLNYRNKELVEEIKNNLRFWLNHGIDGYRVDAVSYLFEDSRFLDEPRKPEEIASKEKNTYKQYYHIYTMDLSETYDMINQFRDVIEEYNQKDGTTRVLIIGAYTSNNITTTHYSNDTDPGTHLPFNFGLIDKLNDESNAANFSNAVYSWLDNIQLGIWPIWVIGNHDYRRVANRFGSEMVDAMNMLNLLLPGTAFTYMGEEIGMEDARVRWDQTVDPMGLNAGADGYLKASRDPERSPFQWNADISAGFTAGPRTWLPVNPNYWRLNLAAQQQQPRSHYAVYRRLTELRRTRTLQRGAFEGHVLSEWVYAFSRTFQGTETYLVVINLGSGYETVDLSDLQVIKEQHVLVHTSSVNSEYSVGDTINKNGFKMRTKSALVLTTDKKVSTSSAASSVSSMKITLAALACAWVSHCGRQSA